MPQTVLNVCKYTMWIWATVCYIIPCLLRCSFENTHLLALVFDYQRMALTNYIILAAQSTMSSTVQLYSVRLQLASPVFHQRFIQMIMTIYCSYFIHAPTLVCSQLHSSIVESTKPIKSSMELRKFHFELEYYCLCADFFFIF